MPPTILADAVQGVTLSCPDIPVMNAVFIIKLDVWSSDSSGSYRGPRTFVNPVIASVH